FLDNVTTHILHLHDGTAKLYAGNYTDFERQRAEHLRQQQIAHQKEQVERAHLQSFIDRFKAKASKARQAQSRMKRLAKLAGTEAVRAERSLHITLPEPLKLPNSLLSLHDADCGYGAAARILANVNFGLEAGDRIGLLGPNGAGKSTLVKTLVGELAPMTGERKAHPDLRIGYFAQHTVESLVFGSTPLDHLRKLAPDVANQELRDFLGRWNFPGERAFEVIDTFSGGEKARLALALLAYRRPNVLLLDEPTNHLDLDMREALAEALSDFDGAIVMVSHDRHLIGLVCDEYWRVAGGKVEPFDGDLDEYAAWLRSRPGSDNPKTPAPKAQPAIAAAPARPAAKVNPHKLQKAEALVAELEAKLAGIDTQLADPKVYVDAARVAGLGREQASLRTQLEAAEAGLLAMYD
ncbi:MAG TPA: ABC-F family ATP-binding cassette domain-containing protein, partial [Thermomonas sp.]|nr:ABC-F family ATP-binding cassette domain-containing protein [Thermomonas sp.]